LKDYSYKSLLQFIVMNGGPEERELVLRVRRAAAKILANLTESDDDPSLVTLSERQLLGIINAQHFAEAHRQLKGPKDRSAGSQDVEQIKRGNWSTLFATDTEKERQKLQEGYLESLEGWRPPPIEKSSPLRDPRMVVEALLKALARVDVPVYNNGIRVMRSFMHPHSTLKRFETDEELRKKIEETNYKCLLNNRDFMWHQKPLTQRRGEIVELKTKVLESEAREWVEVEWVLEALDHVWYLRQVRTRLW